MSIERIETGKAKTGAKYWKARTERAEQRAERATDEVAHLRFVIDIKDGEISHLRTQMDLVPTVGLFRRLWQVFREQTESQVSKVRRMS